MAGDETFEAKGAIQWLPYIKTAVNDAVKVGVLQEGERVLFENFMLGLIGVEAGGANPYIKRPHGWAASSGGEGAGNAGPDASSDGLTQLIPHHLYADENPFDPLTNIKAGLRTLVRYYRGYGNRWDLAGMEHLTGDASDPNKGDDAGFMQGGGYAGRIIQINKKARELMAKGDVPMAQGGYNVDDLTSKGMALAPPWDITDPPDLPFDWTPPITSRAYELYSGQLTGIDYYNKVKGSGVNLQVGHQDQDNIGSFDALDPIMLEPIQAPMIVPRQATQQEITMATSNHVPAKGGRTYATGGQQNTSAPTWFAESPNPPQQGQAPQQPAGVIPQTKPLSQTPPTLAGIETYKMPTLNSAINSVASASPPAVARTIRRVSKPATSYQNPSAVMTPTAQEDSDPLAGLVFDPSQYAYPVNNPNQTNAGWGDGQNNLLTGAPQVDLTSVDNAINSILGSASPEMQSAYKTYAADPAIREKIQSMFDSIMQGGQ